MVFWLTPTAFHTFLYCWCIHRCMCGFVWQCLTDTAAFQIQTTLRVHTGSAPTALSSWHWRMGWSCCSAPSHSFSEASVEESAPPPAAVTSAFLVTTPPAWSSGGRERSRARRTTALTREGSGYKNTKSTLITPDYKIKHWIQKLHLHMHLTLCCSSSDTMETWLNGCNFIT